MAEQRCPMCGKLNPPELDECQFCQARLKPLIVNPFDESQPPAPKQPQEPSPKEAGTPDWLRSLRGHPEDSEFESDEEGLPNWPQHEEEERPGLPSGDESVAPNWLDSLRAPAAPGEDDLMEAGQGDEAGQDENDEDAWVPPGLESGEELPASDWLSGIRMNPEPEELDSEPIPLDADDEGPDWLERIRSRQQAETPAEAVEPEQTQDLPDWLRTNDLSTADTIADWPSSIRDRADETQADWDPDQPAAESDEGLPDWLTDRKGDDGEEPTPDDRPAWLKLGEDTPSNPTDEIPDWMSEENETTPSADDFPDWLETGESPPDELKPEPLNWVSGSSPEDESDAEESIDWTAKEEAALPADDAPEWLRSDEESSELDDVQPEPAGSSMEAETESEEGLPDWLTSSGQDSDLPSEDETPTWLSESPDETTPGETEPDWLHPEEEAASGPDDEIPDWLSEIPTDESSPEDIPVASSAEDLPDWLADLDHEVETDVAEAAADEFATVAEPAEELPGWLAGISPSAADTSLGETPAELPDTEIVPFESSAEDESGELAVFSEDESFADEVPDWLSDVKASEESLEPAADQPAGSKEADLAPADLPSWLEAMRPVETEAAPEILDERDQQVVSAGPLAGLRGVLPAEPEISKVQKPPTYSVKLQVSDMQQERAAMLEDLVQAEGQSRPIPGRPLVSSQNLLRMVFALILFVAVLWPLVTEGPVAPIPVFSPETGAANQIIGQLNSQDPVLVAVDYQPGLSGEMDAITSILFDHMMLRGAYLTLVSTTASGPIQAEHVLALANQQFGHSYLGGDEYTNLGYIPGGPTGLISFASNPRAMMAYALDDGRLAWESSPLQNVQDLSDFALVTVITENPETARAWIEQVQPVLGDTPLIMAISAQAEPMIRPYYEAFPKQVQGMVVGLVGSVTYESLMGHPGLAHDYWNAFDIGLLAAIVLIFVGGVINMLPIFFKGGRENSADREGSR